MKKIDAELALLNPDLAPHTFVDYSTPQIANSEFAELKQIMKRRGLLNKQPVYYTIRVIILFVLMTVGVVSFVAIRNIWFQLFDAVYFAFVYAQIGLLGHEAGHRQMFDKLWMHDLVGLIGGNFFIGMSYAWWIDKHNSHHSHPNQVDMDPDIEIPFLEFTGTKDVFQMSKFRQFLVKHQTIVFLPALMTVSLNLQTSGIRFLLHNKPRYYVVECLTVVAHYVAYIALLFACVNVWEAILFTVVHQALTGLYLGSIFAPNHKGMPVLEKDSKMGFLHRQIITSRNIYGHPLTDFLYGGLNYQIEHHLFPSMPRNKLKEAQQIVKSFCQAHAIPYHETHFLVSYKEIMAQLYLVGAPLRETA